MRRIFLRWVYSHVDYALYTGVHNRNYFLKHRVSDKQLIWAPHAIDNIRFAKEATERQEQAGLWRRKLGIGDGDKLFLFAGKLENKKNPWALLHLAKRLSGKECKFLIVGNGHLEEELKQAAAEDKRIIFLDFQNQATMPVLYRMADIFVLPSVGPGETWGLAINEAMACSIPVLVSDKCGGAPDLVKDEVNGYTFDHKNIEDLFIKAEKLTNKSKTELRKMGEASLNIVSSFSFTAIVQAIVKCI
jgi:glycosyltransferase involved in cell wall biosynthesis